MFPFWSHKTGKWLVWGGPNAEERKWKFSKVNRVIKEGTKSAQVRKLQFKVRDPSFPKTRDIQKREPRVFHASLKNGKPCWPQSRAQRRVREDAWAIPPDHPQDTPKPLRADRFLSKIHPSLQSILQLPNQQKEANALPERARRKVCTVPDLLLLQFFFRQPFYTHQNGPLRVPREWRSQKVWL